jgi:hypothetical protein
VSASEDESTERVTEYRESGIEVLAGEPALAEQFPEGITETTLFRLPTVLAVDAGDVVGNPVTVEAQYFVAADIDDDDPDEVHQQMLDVDEVHEAALYVSNADGEEGPIIWQQQGADAEDVFEHFETEVMPDTGVTTDPGAPEVAPEEDEEESSEQTTADLPTESQSAQSGDSSNESADEGGSE